MERMDDRFMNIAKQIYVYSKPCQDKKVIVELEWEQGLPIFTGTGHMAPVTR